MRVEELSEEQRHLVYEAIELVQQAQDLIDEAVDGTSQEAHFLAYGRYGFDQLLGNGNPYDKGLYDLLRDEEE